jgi:hypothetical protein
MSKTETQSDALTAERRLFITAVANLELRKKFGDEGFRLDLERDELEALIEMAERTSRLDARVKSLEFAFNEWHDKTNWVQETAQALELGMHRADVLRARIEALDAENKALRERMEAAPSAPSAGWISVDVVLPPKNTEVAIWFAESTIPSTGQYTGLQADPNGWSYPSENYLSPGEHPNHPEGGDPTVTHWMELHAPGAAQAKEGGV